MAKAVFTVSEQSEYQDVRERWYHFPSRYLKKVRSAIGDLVIFYEPRRNVGSQSSGGAQSYIAMARVTGVRSDPERFGHHFADLSEYILFDREVPFRVDNHYFEAALRKEDGTTNRGAFGWSVRALPDYEFDSIFRYGFTRILSNPDFGDSINALYDQSQEVLERPIISMSVNRKVRDLAFREKVRQAYNNTCAVSGLSLIDSSGLPEVQAAHIRAVAFNGPDTTCNGIALTATAHWLFDRGMIAISDDYRIILSTHFKAQPTKAILEMNHQLIIPACPKQVPNIEYLRWHRSQVFAG
ncbi:HNH endonuclease [Stenotrophomonas indicatrix]|uniref:HNH endonuclease n=1 Tax=Stenotrophomonas indicatrix TaxID=2045451 RepID=UPI002899E7D2|nr:HNH endonuclease [Stenotrophomonas indicatrix]